MADRNSKRAIEDPRTDNSLLGEPYSAAGVAALRPAWLRWSIAPAFLALSLIGNDYYIEADRKLPRTKGSDADLAAAIVPLWQPNDVILCTSLTRAPLEYYLGRAGIEARILSFPRHTARNLGAQNDWELVRDREALMQEAQVVLDEARRLTEPDGRLFLLRSDIKTNSPLLPSVLRRKFYVFPEVVMGIYDQTGTGQRIALSLNRIHAAPAADEAP